MLGCGLVNYRFVNLRKQSVLEIRMWRRLLQTQKDTLASGKMRESAGYIDSCNAFSESGRLHGTRTLLSIYGMLNAYDK